MIIKRHPPKRTAADPAGSPERRHTARYHLRRERRSGVDRRSGKDRRGKRKKWGGPERRTVEERRSGLDRRDRRGLRIPIFVKMSILSTALILLILSVVGFIVLEKEKRIFEKQLIHYGKSAVQIISTNAPEKLLAEEDLALFKLMEDIARNEYVLYTLVTNPEKVIKAHSDIERTDEIHKDPDGLRFVRACGDIKFSTYSQDGREAFYFEAPLEFQNVLVGYVGLALSREQIERNIREAKVFFLVLTLATIALGIVLSLAISMYFSRPINELKETVGALGQGDLGYRAHIKRKDEFGDLGVAVNRMAHDLELKERIEDSFGRYVAPEIVDMILAHPERQWMRGTRVNATVLFVDIRGFMTLAEDKDPAWVVELLNDYFKKITDVVISHGGYVNKFAGDEVMAVFGAPIEDECHADTAVAAAVDIQKAVRSIESSDENGPVRIQAGVGVNSGEVIAGNLGSEKRMEYTVTGDGVNVASRLTQIARPGEILISKETLELMTDTTVLGIEKKGNIKVKGRRTKISVYNVPV